MYVEIQTLRWKNLLSYGNNLNEINFESGMTLITAQNGGGKSSVLDALSFCWFGQPYRDIKIGELVNRKNKKKLWTECLFKIDNVEYRIVRTHSPASIEIWKDGQSLELLSSKRLNQEEINKILGVDYNIFKQVVCLAINNTTSSFLSQSIGEKRNIIESIFNIKIFGEMLSKLKNKNKELKVESQILERTLHIQEASLRTLMKQIKDIKNTKENFESDKNQDLELISDFIKQKTDKKEELISKSKILLEELTELNTTDKNDYDNDLETINSKIAVNKSIIKNNKERALTISENDVCPICSTIMDAEHKQREIDQLKTNTFELSTEVKELEKTKLEILSRKEELNKRKTRVTNIETEIRIINSTINQITTEITHKKTEEEKIKARTFVFDIDSLEVECETKKDEYSKQFKKHASILEDIKYNEFAASVLSDQGIKTYFFKRLIPVLNSKINEYLDNFELPVSLTFNEFMEENISLLSSSEKNLSYMSFSEGEKKRIDISLMLSFIDTMKVVSNWNTNILMFDEILDSSTDSYGLDRIMGAVKQMTIDNEKLCCYIISHRENDHSNYTGKITIKKSKGFSSIVQE